FVMKYCNDDQMTSQGWLTAAQRVEDVIEMYPNTFTPDGIRRRQEFIAYVRAHNGAVDDEVYTWDAVKRLLAY
ncbi:MAG: hypothetical protein LUD53_04725, partial [Clostridiales bacterium]|nr:hypothetical protein [Clostridiales bacterium]